jgi:asparagine synthase (glutamine-hydrolysing)
MMCGICGIYNYHSHQPVNKQTLEAMLQVIEHRGPDDEGVHIDQDVGLGFRRLSIIDLAGGHQPMFNEDGTIGVIFNGEIYNFKQVRQQLEERGHTFSTTSDTEVIVHLYEDYGDDCVNHLQGMFGFAVWDSVKRRLLVARDRLGIKPLYYTTAGDQLVFGSEIKPILQHPHVHAQANLEALSAFLSLKYVPSPYTMFDGIHALPPGHLLVCEPDKGVSVRQYWDLSFNPPQNGSINEESYVEQLEQILRETVEMHLVSDVPFGAFLSGGIDSSTIVALMSQVLNEPVKTFSVGFEGAGEAVSELPFAHMVAKQYGTDHYDIFISPQDFIDLTPKVIWHLDQPIADDACLANFMVAKLASQHVKMVLTGEGGDELFAGYARYAGEQFSPVFKRIPAPVRSAMLAMSGMLPGMRRQKLALYALCQQDEVTRLLNWFPLFNSDMKAALVSDSFSQEVQRDIARESFAAMLERTNATSALNRMLYVDTKYWLVDDLLARGDKTSMGTSLEARVPFLDHKVVEFAASVPPSLKLKGLQRKYLLKQVSRKLLPDAIIDRKKKGFPIPIPIWIRNEARPFVRDVLSHDAISRRGLFDVAAVEKLLNEHETGFADHGSLIWSLLSIELWYQQFID